MKMPSECGQSVILYVKAQTGTDSMGMPVYEETPETVDNVFIGYPTQEEVVTELTLTGRKWLYTLGIPKGDAHDWEDAAVEFGGRRYRTYGAPVRGNPDLMPFDWCMNVKVEAYE